MKKIKTQELVAITQELLKAKGHKVNKDELNAVFQAIPDAVVETFEKVDGECKITMSGKLTFIKSLTPERERINPSSGEKFVDSAKYHLKIKAGSGFKQAVKDIPVNN
jgi:nucleoid DNA-binding protein